jgi:hypothetical protein
MGCTRLAVSDTRFDWRGFLIFDRFGGAHVRDKSHHCIFASLLALILAVASVQSLAGQRLSELTDSDWLVDYEEKHGLEVAHGIPWRDRRLDVINQQLKSRMVTDRAVAWTRKKVRSLAMWFWTMVGIAVAALAVLGISIFDPALLAH